MSWRGIILKLCDNAIFKYNSADFRQNAFSIVYPKAKHLRQLTKISKPTTNQELEEQTFCLKSSFITFIHKDCVEDREMQSFTFSFVYITSSKLFTVFYISMELSPMKITGQPLRRFSRHC